VHLVGFYYNRTNLGCLRRGLRSWTYEALNNRMKTAFIMCTFQRYHYYDEIKEAETGEGGRACMMHLEGEKCRYIKF